MAFLPEPVASAADVEDVAVVQETVQHRRGDHAVAQELAPFAEAFVGSQDDAAQRSLRLPQGLSLG